MLSEVEKRLLSEAEATVDCKGPSRDYAPFFTASFDSAPFGSAQGA
ncbi:hypothetical protein ACX8XP_04875 [Calditrichota bacterium LG25]